MMKPINRLFYLVITISIILADQLSKYFIRSSYNLFEQSDVIKGFFRIVYVRNDGAVWGFLSGNRNPLITKTITILAIVALCVVIYLFFKMKSINKLEILALSFIAGGAIGNIIDRISLGYVVDFIELYVKQFRWPTFNIADSFISIGMIMLVFTILKSNTKNTKETGEI